MNLVTGHLDFLLDDSRANPEFREGGSVNGEIVFSTINSMREHISQIFRVPSLDVGLWHSHDCTIQLNGYRDREVPGKPLCQGNILITGTRENVERVITLLEGAIPEITKRQHLRAYQFD